MFVSVKVKIILKRYDYDCLWYINSYCNKCIRCVVEIVGISIFVEDGDEFVLKWKLVSMYIV